jgi:hypothetical protein
LPTTDWAAFGPPVTSTCSSSVRRNRRVGDLLLAAGRVVDVDLQVRRKDGSILDGVFSGEVVESQGQRHSLTVMVDHTEAKQARDDLLRATRICETVGLAGSGRRGSGE